MTLETKLVELAKDCGASGAGNVPMADIAFHTAFRTDCEKNTCGHYGQSWTCPPAVGPIQELISQAKSYEAACVVCSVGKVERGRGSGFIEKLDRQHYDMTRRFAREASSFVSRLLPLGAGYCMGCPRCAKLDNEPCRQPDEAMASLEAYGIAVTPLAKSAGLAYNAGRGTLTFFGALLYTP